MTTIPEIDEMIAELKRKITALNSIKYKKLSDDSKSRAEKPDACVKRVKFHPSVDVEKKYVLWMVSAIHAAEVAFIARDENGKFVWGRNTKREDSEYEHLGTKYVTPSEMKRRFGNHEEFWLHGPDCEDSMSRTLEEFEAPDANIQELMSDERYGAF